VQQSPTPVEQSRRRDRETTAPLAGPRAPHRDSSGVGGLPICATATMGSAALAARGCGPDVGRISTKIRPRTLGMGGDYGSVASHPHWWEVGRHRPGASRPRRLVAWRPAPVPVHLGVAEGGRDLPPVGPAEDRAASLADPTDHAPAWLVTALLPPLAATASTTTQRLVDQSLVEGRIELSTRSRVLQLGFDPRAFCAVARPPLPP
jgi:hypothetical protein